MWADAYNSRMSLAAITENKNLLFWALQLWGWSAWAVTTYLGVAFVEVAPTGYPMYLGIIATIGMVLTLPVRYVYTFTWDNTAVSRAFVVLIASYFSGLVWLFLRRKIFFTMFPEDAAKMIAKAQSEWIMFFEGSLQAGSVMLVWSALYFGIKYYLLSQEEKQRYLAAMGRAHQAQLKMLRYQLNPHFLFNTLNAISTLILDQDNKTANEMVSKLSGFLRYSLESDPMREVSVKDEVASMMLYLEIEKVRFGERLNLEVFVADEAANASMPSMLLQPLIENSIKYAIAKSVEGGTIRITALRQRDFLQLSVVDDGPGVEQKQDLLVSGTGVGIKNIQGRLKELYGDNQFCELRPSEPRGLTVVINLPFHHPESMG